MRGFSLVLLVATATCISACSRNESPGPSPSLFEKTKAMALSGNALAQHDFGLVHLNGELVPKDDAEAVKWFTKAANQGLAIAQNQLGLIHLEGELVPKAGWVRTRQSPRLPRPMAVTACC